MNPHGADQISIPEISHQKIAFSNYHHGGGLVRRDNQSRGSQQQGRQGSNKANFRIKQLP